MSAIPDILEPTDNAPLAHVDGWPIYLANRDHALKVLTAAAIKGEGYSFAPLNLDLLVKLRTDGVFVNAMQKARFIIADGWPIALLGRRENRSIERTTGADLILPLCANAVRHKLPIYLFGTSSEVLGRVQEVLKEQFPELVIAGAELPLLGFDARSAVADQAIERMHSSGAKLCFLALGAPKQEILAARALDMGAKIGFVCVGAGLDFIAGAQVRAPGFMRNNGMEWLWRLVTNPRRLGARYAVCAMLLAKITLIEPLQRRSTSPRA